MTPEVTGVPQTITLQVKGVWQGECKTAVSVRHFYPFTIDEPPALGGSDSGPNPMEYMLGALCGCTAVMIGKVAAEMGFSYASLEMEAEGTIDSRGFLGQEGVRPHFQTVRETVRLGTAEPQERVTALRQAVERRCPAINLFRDARIQTTVKWEVW